MTEFAHAVNFTMSFGTTVLPEDINKMRKALDMGENYSIYNIELTKNHHNRRSRIIPRGIQKGI